LHPFEDYPELEVTLVDDDKVLESRAWQAFASMRFERALKDPGHAQLE
jgi:hypothetical protein